MTCLRSPDRQRGSVTLVFLFSIVSITLSLLAAIDVMRYNLVQSRLQNALDAAVLAAGRNLGNLSDTPSQSDQEAWKQDALGYLRANMPDGYLGSSYDIGQVTVTVSGDARAGQQIGMHATARLPLLVAGFLATKELPMAAGNTATRRSRSDLELVMVLDNTGSMQWVDKSDTVGRPNRLDALKNAANTLVDTLFDENIPNSNFSVGLVPFTTTVNPRDVNGNKMSRLLKNGSTYPLTASSWAGCLVDPRETGGRMPTPPRVLNPADRPFTAYFDTNQTGSNTYSVSSNQCIATPTTFLTGDRKTIKNGINAMVADGGTIIPAGAMWGWRMLSPGWRGASGWGSSTLPQDKSSFLTKAMIIMTDGENGGLQIRGYARHTQFGTPDISRLSPYYGNNFIGNYSQVSAFDADDGSASLPPYGLLYKYPSDWVNRSQQLENNATSLATLNKLLLATCSAAKADGIKIWTITFSSGAKNPETQNTMRNCASEAYYHAPTNADLQTIFKSIAGQLSELRLVK